MNSLRKTIDQLYQVFVGFLWRKARGEKEKHWVAWEDIFFQKMKGCIGFRSLYNFLKNLFRKLWLNFLTSTSLWSSFMWNK